MSKTYRNEQTGRDARIRKAQQAVRDARRDRRDLKRGA